MNKENSLLLICSKLALDNPSRQKIKEISSSELDWEYLLEKSLEEGLSGLLYKHLKNLHIKPPDNIIKELENSYFQNLAWNMALLESLDNLLEMINPFPVILLKGAAFLKTIYKRDIGLRYLGDIDLFIKKNDFKAISSQLEENGFTIQPFEKERFIKKSLIVDIHTDLFSVSMKSLKYAVKINSDLIWNDAIPMIPDYTHTHVFVLSPEDNIIILALHALKHAFTQQIWFVDMNEIILFYKDLDWKILLQKAESYNLIRPLYYSLFYLKKMMNSPIPDFVLKKDLNFKYLEKKTMDLLLKNKMKGTHGEFLLICGIPKFSQKFAYLFEFFFPSSSTLSEIYHLKNTPFLYLYRLFRLIFIIPKETARFFSKILKGRIKH
jgi:hypothetical protein